MFSHHAHCLLQGQMAILLKIFLLQAVLKHSILVLNKDQCLLQMYFWADLMCKFSLTETIPISVTQIHLKF